MTFADGYEEWMEHYESCEEDEATDAAIEAALTGDGEPAALGALVAGLRAAFAAEPPAPGVADAHVAAAARLVTPAPSAQPARRATAHRSSPRRSMLSSFLPTTLAKVAAVIGSFTIGTSSLALAGALPGPIQDRLDGGDTEQVATVPAASAPALAAPAAESPVAAAHLPEPGTPVPEVVADLGEHAEELVQLGEERVEDFLERVDPDGTRRQAVTERLDEVAGRLAERAPELDAMAEQARQRALEALAEARQQAEEHAEELAATLEAARQRLLERLADVRARLEADADRPIASALLGQLDEIAARIEGLELGEVDAIDGWFDTASGLLDALGERDPSELLGGLLDRVRERLAPPAPVAGD